MKWKVKKYLGGTDPSGRRNAFLIRQDQQASDSAESAVLDETTDPYYRWKSQVNSLNETIKSTRSDSKQMTSYMIESKLEDRDIDQAYRSSIATAGNQLLNESAVISAFLSAVKKK